MNKIAFALLGAAALSMTAACNKSPSDNLAENVQDNYENAADNVGAMADNAAAPATADALENQADALRNEADRKADKIDDQNISSATPAQVNAM